ncbi:hypothetical protein GVO57_06290 [Sphingomonas changnyeongensis]|uniref:Uncharacterized protein n=1 Tax=Sphingomonas changnyeongensis TaxID=2698679 RepID=A0A7Z2S8D1_9SPHN|nr:hypothetical protein [Sphingomonas changnyeongensis]QHL90522.1 hypothetical protein GVO57_06290 [Sphingomonas changnyeongensis]
MALHLMILRRPRRNRLWPTRLRSTQITTDYFVDIAPGPRSNGAVILPFRNR